MGRVLPNRRNIIITRQSDLNIPGAEITNSLSNALDLTADDEEVFIIGGSEIFKLALPLLKKIYLTKINQNFQADSFFPPISPDEWQEVEREDFSGDEKAPFSYSFLTYEASLSYHFMIFIQNFMYPSSCGYIFITIKTN